MKRHVDLELAGTSYRLTPNPASALRVATEVNDPTQLLTEAGLNARLGVGPKLDKVWRVLWIALCENGYDMSFEEAQALLFSVPVAALYDPYGEFLFGLVHAGDMPDDVAKAMGLGEGTPGKAAAPGNRAARRAGGARKSRAAKKTPRKGAAVRASKSTGAV